MTSSKNLAATAQFLVALATSVLQFGVLGGHYGADSVSLCMNIITSSNQFKPIRIKKKVVVNYNKKLCHMEMLKTLKIKYKSL